MFSNTTTLILVAGAAMTLLSFLLCAAVTRYVSRRGLLVQPGERHSHDTATPTGGGLGIILSIAVATAVFFSLDQLPLAWSAVVFPGAMLLAFVGWLDDARPMSAWLRLIVQLAVSLYLVGFMRESGQLTEAWHAVFAVGFLVWMMNLFNFMDGSDGMAGFQATYAGLVMCIILALNGHPQLALPACFIASASLGFLPWNFPRARVFMGDVASVPLGFLIGALLLLGTASTALHPGVALLVMAVFLADATPTLLRRVIRGERWYTPHKQHVYQRLIEQGCPHSRVLIIYQAINVFLVLPATVVAVMYPEHAWPVTGSCFLLLITGWYAASRGVEVQK